MASQMSGFAGIHVEHVLRVTGKKLSPLPSSCPELLLVLAHIARHLSFVYQAPFESMKDAMYPIVDALIAKELVRHVDMDVKILVVWCNCEILRIMAPDAPYSDQQLKGFFELATKIFGKLTRASGQRYTRLTNVLTLFRRNKLPVMMLDLELNNLIAQLFKQFLRDASSKLPDVVVYEMEMIMTYIIEECNEPMPELVRPLLMSVRKDNQLQSNWQLGEEVLKNCAGLLKPCLLDIISEMGFHLQHFSGIVAHICNSVSENEATVLSEKQDDGRKLRKDTSHKRKLEWIEGSSNAVRHRQQATRDTVNLVAIHSDDEKETLSVSGDPIIPSTSCIIIVRGYKVKNSIAPILESIFRKHCDIAAECLFKTPSVRVSFLEIVCEVVTWLKTNDDKLIISKMEEIESKVSEAEAANINVSWILSYLEAFHKATEKSTLLMELIAKTSMVKKAAKMDLNERREALMAAQQHYEKAERCVRVLDLVEKKLNNNILDSKTEQDLWARQSIVD